MSASLCKKMHRPAFARKRPFHCISMKIRLVRTATETSKVHNWSILTYRRRRDMVEILPIWRKTLSDQSVHHSVPEMQHCHWFPPIIKVKTNIGLKCLTRLPWLWGSTKQHATNIINSSHILSIINLPTVNTTKLNWKNLKISCQTIIRLGKESE